MKVQVKLFAAAKELAGSDALQIELPAGSRVADLRRALVDRAPRLSGLMGHVAFAVDAEYADDQTVLSDGCDVACIPPVSGG